MNASIHNTVLPTGKLIRLLMVLAIVWQSSCKKGILDEKPRTDILIPTTLPDFQALLDNPSVMNETPELGELSADNYYFTYSAWQLLSQPHQRNSYVWTPDIYGGRGNIEDWNKPYTQVLYANIILEGLDKVPVDNSNRIEWNRIKGSALFARAYAFYNVSQLFAEAYDSGRASTALGVPLRLRANITDKIPRATLQETYDRMLADLLTAKDLLPATVPALNRNRACKFAAMALLARVYLSMRSYEKAGAFADSVLQSCNKLVDYNSLSTANPLPFGRDSAETIFQSRILFSSGAVNGLNPGCFVDSVLYQSYNNDDLRRTLYYSSGFNLKGTYTGNFLLFSGLATDELYLIRAECNARAGKVTEAMADLNTLLIKRWKTNTFIPFTASTPDTALAIILQERRKELAFRGLRWSDLRRLNKEGAHIILKRKLNAEVFTLNPNSPLYVLPIPPDAVLLGELVQNER
jgi:starch-binding outer membrane protein, SusD/RagB family